MKRFIYNMIVWGAADVICISAIILIKNPEIKILFFGLLLITGVTTLIHGICIYPCKKEEKDKPMETLRLGNLRPRQSVLIIKGNHIRKTGIIQKLFEDFDWHCGISFDYALVLLNGEIESRKFYSEFLEVIDNV